MRTTIDLPDNLIRRAKSIAARKGISLKTLFTRALQNETSSLEGSVEKPPKRVQFPLILSSNKHEPVHVTNEEIEELLTQDDVSTGR